jgi:hypothetical protein
MKLSHPLYVNLLFKMIYLHKIDITIYNIICVYIYIVLKHTYNNLNIRNHMVARI